MTLEEFLVTKKGILPNGTEGYIVNIADYYDKYVKTLDTRFKDSTLNGSRLVVCPIHDDHDPSLGLINSKGGKGVKIFHCFGCGRSGSVVRLHQLVESKYHHKKLSEEDACKELARMFNVDLGDFEELREDDYEGKYERALRKLDDLIKDSYNFTDYASDLKVARSMPSKSAVLAKTNEAVIKMVATSKQLYD